MVNRYSFFPREKNPEEFKPYVAGLIGSFVHEQTGEEVSFEEVEHVAADKTVGADEYWEVRGDDGTTYFVREDGTVADDLDNVVGNFLAYAKTADILGEPRIDYKCPECGSRDVGVLNGMMDEMQCDKCGTHANIRAFEDEEPVDEDHESKVGWTIEADGGYSLQGALTGESLYPVEGIAINMDKTSKEEVTSLIKGLATPDQQQRDFVQDKNKEKGTTFPVYDSPYLNRGGSTKEADGFNQAIPAPGEQAFPEQFFGEGYILVKDWFTPDDAWAASLNKQQIQGIITNSGGLTSHAVVVARGMGIPVIVDTQGLGKINTGDHVKMDTQSGVIDVNGGDPNFERGPGEMASMGTTRFVFWNGDVRTAPIDPNNPEGGTLHTDLMEEFEGFDYENFAMGTIYEDKHADLLMDGEVPGAEEWLQEQGVQDIRMVGDMSMMAKVADNNPLKCGECGSHSVRMMGDPKDGKGDIKCLTCGNEFKREVMKNPQAKTAAVIRYQFKDGAPQRVEVPAEQMMETMKQIENQGGMIIDVVHNPQAKRDRTAEAFLDSQPVEPANSYYHEAAQKEHLKGVDSDKRQRQYEHIKEQCLSDGGSEDDCKELAARTVNKQRAEKGETKKGGPEDFDINDALTEPRHELARQLAEEAASQMTRSEREAPFYAAAEQLAAQTGMGFVAARDLIRAALEEMGVFVGTGVEDDYHGGNPMPLAKVATFPVEPGEWYVMKSPQYKVPDVIQVLNVEDNRIEAAIEGDDKGMFPIHITPEEIEKNGYTFEPYTQTEAATGLEPVTAAPEFVTQPGTCPHCGSQQFSNENLSEPALMKCWDCGEEFESPESVPGDKYEYAERNLRGGGWKIARKSFTPAQQRALIDENEEGRARNIEKMNLDGTHYTMWEPVESKDDLSDFFLW